jgi:histone-lysine N-methyltransferase SUV39H
MWGLYSEEFIPAGSFVVEYVGEVVSAKDGDRRGKIYDNNCMSYLFDMNDYDEDDTLDARYQKRAFEDFFPLCIDATYYGNESRFINHSCDPNLKSYNLVTDVESITFHHIGLFATRNI